MKLKDLIFPIALALITTMIIQYFFFGGKKTQTDDTQVRSGQAFKAPKTRQEIKPLNKEIDFIDEKRLYPTVETKIETKLATFVFTNDGAALSRLEFHGDLDGDLQAIGTVFPVASTERERKCLLLAMGEKTPYYYKFMGKEETDLAIQVRYRYDSPNNDIVVDKLFTVYKKTHKIDLMTTVTPKKKLAEDQSLQARIFFPSPIMPQLGKSNVVSAVVVNEKGAVQKTLMSKLDEYVGYLNPKLFGTDSKYFVQVMIEDPNQFVKRAYYKSEDTVLFSILEGPDFNEKSSWTVSFYFGPKEEKAMATVDARLEKTLEYSGWLAPIAKFLLMILKFLYKYLHNYGLAIIVLTLLIKLLLLPFSIKAESGMKKRVAFQKKLDYLQKKYKDDKVTLARERAELIKKHGMPGLGGCLPLLLQLPIFFALTRVLGSSIELYKAPFLWINDLSAKDPYYILPILISISMLIQAATTDPKQRFTIIAMALVFGAISANFSAGLSLYIFSSVLLGLIQTALVKKIKP